MTNDQVYRVFCQALIGAAQSEEYLAQYYTLTHMSVHIHTPPHPLTEVEIYQIRHSLLSELPSGHFSDDNTAGGSEAIGN